jgi:hypothetical protein
MVVRQMRQRLFRAAAMLVAGIGVYAPTLQGAWLCDDDVLVTNNDLVQSESWAGLVRLWLDPSGVDFFPLTYSLFWGEWLVFGLDPTGYHATTILLHVASGLLLWYLLAALSIRGAWVAAMAFTLHPACVESVAWISETKNTLSLPLFLGSCIFWVRQDDATEGARQKWLYAASLVLFLLAMLAKPSIVAMPVVTLLYAWWKRGNIESRDVVHAVPFFLVSIILGIVTIQFQHGRAIGFEQLPIGGFASRIAVAGMAILFYLATIVWPVNLLPTYPAWEVDPPRPWQFLPWAMVAAGAWWMWKDRATWGRHAILGLGFFLLMIAPVLGFVDMSYMRVSWVADHFLYVPMIGPLALVVATGAHLADRTGWRTAATAVGGGVVMLLAVNSFWYGREWVNEDRLWEYTLARTNDSWIAHNRLGLRKLGRSDTDGAIHHFRNASRLRPDLGETNNNLGSALMRKGLYAEAIPALQKAVRASPWLGQARRALADAYCKVGRFAEARDLAAELLKGDPTNRKLLMTLGLALLGLGEKEKAIEQFQSALSIDPDYEPALEALGKAQ